VVNRDPVERIVKGELVSIHFAVGDRKRIALPTSTVPVSVVPSCLKVNVSGKLLPSGAFASPVHVPVTSAAIAVAALNVIANAAHTQSNFLIGFIIIPSSQAPSLLTHHTARQ